MKFEMNLTDFNAKGILIILSLLWSTAEAQIITTTPNAETPKDKKETTERPEKKDPSDTEIYFGVSPMYTFRTLVSNEGLFSEELGDRALEFGEWVSSYGIGLRSGLTQHLVLDIGLGVSRNRESFSLDEPDTLYQYTSTYRHIAIPIQIGYTYGKEISFFTSIGLMPKAFLSQRKDIFYRDYAGFEVEEKEIIRDKYQQFLVDAIGRIGLRFQANNNYGFYLMGEGFYQLTNNYISQGPYVRHPFGVGLSVGFQVYL
jgi:hypothetical protein